MTGQSDVWEALITIRQQRVRMEQNNRSELLLSRINSNYWYTLEQRYHSHQKGHPVNYAWSVF